MAYGQSVKNKRSSYALVCETLKFKSVIDEIFETTRFFKETKLKRNGMVYVLVYDFMFGHGRIQGGGLVKKKVLACSNRMQSALARIKIRQRVKENIDLLPPYLRKPNPLPRYARINRLKATMESTPVKLK